MLLTQQNGPISDEETGVTRVMNQLLFHYSEDTVAREKRLTLSSPLKQLSVFDPLLQRTASPTIFFCYCTEQQGDRNLNKTGLEGFPLRSVFFIALLWFSCVVNAYWEKRDLDFRQLIKNTLQKKVWVTHLNLILPHTF